MLRNTLATMAAAPAAAVLGTATPATTPPPDPIPAFQAAVNTQGGGELDWPACVPTPIGGARCYGVEQTGDGDVIWVTVLGPEHTPIITSTYSDDGDGGTGAGGTLGDDVLVVDVDFLDIAVGIGVFDGMCDAYHTAWPVLLAALSFNSQLTMDVLDGFSLYMLTGGRDSTMRLTPEAQGRLVDRFHNECRP